MQHDQLIEGYRQFKQRYGSGDNSIMSALAKDGQAPKHMIVACCDSRVDPALLLQTEPGDLFVVRNVANIVPPYEKDNKHHGTSAALEFGICYLNIQHVIIFGHSECGGMQALTGQQELHQDDFISNWVHGLGLRADTPVSEAAKTGLIHSYKNCLTFPWITDRVNAGTLEIELWYLDIQQTQIERYEFSEKTFVPLFQDT